MRHPHRWTAGALTLLLVLTACQETPGPLITEPDGPDVEEVGPAPPTAQLRSLEGMEGYWSVGEIRTGFIYDWNGTPMRITYEVHDGLAIWQGDIVLGPADEIAGTLAQLTASATGPLPGVVIDDNAKRWPGGVVPWQNDDADPVVVNAAVDMIEDETPGIDMVPYDGSQPNYITFQDASGCSSAIGMQGGEQKINLRVLKDGLLCTIGSGAHEILHALGQYHEHTRCDRENFVTIDYAEIESGKEHNFYEAGSDAQGENCGDDQAVFDIGSYDFGSIMHYATDAFAVGSNPTIIPIAPVPPGVTIGQRAGLSDEDVNTVDVLYGHFNDAPVASIVGPAGDLLEGSVLTFDASGSTDADDDDDLLTFEWDFGDGTCAVASPPFACTDDDPDHAYADNGTYSYQVTVSDGFDEGSDGGSVTIANVAPTVDAGADATLDEGDTFNRSGSFTDPGADTWTATVDYGEGDGAEALSLAGKSFSLSNTYVDNVGSPFTVSVSVTDDDAGVGSDDVDVTVNNVAPSVDAGPDAEVESGQSYGFSGTFSDPGVEDDPWGWVIEWGDGTPDDAGSTGDQSAPIEASHQVCAAGAYTVALTVTDKDGGVGSDDLTLTVPYVMVAIDILPGSDENPINLRRGGGTIPVAVLGSADFDVADVDPSTLTLGDESDPDTSVQSKNNGTVSASLEDVNGDGFMDLVAHFSARALANNGDLDELTSELVLRGFQADACTNFRGADMVMPLTS